MDERKVFVLSEFEGWLRATLLDLAPSLVAAQCPLVIAPYASCASWKRHVLGNRQEANAATVLFNHRERTGFQRTFMLPKCR